MKFESTEIDEKKLIGNINYALTHRHYFSMLGLQSTFHILTMKANQIYADFLIKHYLFPEEYFTISQYYDQLRDREEQKKLEEMQPEALELRFPQTSIGQIQTGQSFK